MISGQGVKGNQGDGKWYGIPSQNDWRLANVEASIPGIITRYSGSMEDAATFAQLDRHPFTFTNADS